MAEPVQAYSFGCGVQFNVGDFLRPVYAEDLVVIILIKNLYFRLAVHTQHKLTNM